MFATLLTWIEAIVLPYGAWGIFVASVVEEVIAPIPSTLVQMGGGFLLMQDVPVTLESIGRLLVVVVVPATAGLLVGSLMAFFIGKYVGKQFFMRFGKYLWMPWEEIEQAAVKIQAHNNMFGLLVLVRSIPILPAAIVSATAGLLQVKLSQYILATILGTLVRASVLGFVGWQLGAGYKAVAPYVERFEKIGFVLFVVLILSWWWMKRKKKTVVPPVVPR